ncbi:alpha/beta hydrolase [Mycobacterium pseudokansasii]|uniref:alpha/beta hydrolase n=1 Tax=Mycobacterium pseudokansasii TaxID=2341080 RepID=UPI000F029934|nr:alpha/beta hydrolase [Mycobacterium pseudokansasii]VBA34358.1 Carboxylesterase NlhH [Mycobacterium pseudokansasii]VBA35816.1 Carboxylesterase NlhH [Mycobacterium pseudokansasii]
MSGVDENPQATEELCVQRISDQWALIFENSGDAAQLRHHLSGNCAPRRHIEVARVRSRRAPGPEGRGDVPVRIYEPLRAHTRPRVHTAPLVVYFHGGGFVLRDPEAQDAACRRLANGVGGVVVAVDYRLAPQNRFPAAVEDAWSATRWASTFAHQLGCDPDRLVVAGEGAGGNLAAGVSLLARDRAGPPIALQLLIYPILDQRRRPTAAPTGTRRPVVTAEQLHWFSDQYLRSEDDRLNPLASPILADLTGLPPAHLVAAEADPLRGDGDRFARRLREARVAVTARTYPGMFRGFVNLPDRLPRVERYNAEIYATVRHTIDDQ